MASIGVNVGHTGGSMLGETMVAFKGVSLAAGMAGKVVGNFADRASSRAGAAASGSSGFLQGGLAGVVSRKITNDAVRTATQTTQKASSSTMSAAHQATERTVNAERQAASVVHQAKRTRSESASQKSQMGVTHQQVASSTRTASVSSLHRESQHSVGLGGRLFANSLLEGGRFANDVIGMVAAGDLHSTGSITGEFASQALSSYMGITAQGDAAPQISYSGIEIGGLRRCRLRLLSRPRALRRRRDPQAVKSKKKGSAEYSAEPFLHFVFIFSSAGGCLHRKRAAFDTLPAILTAPARRSAARARRGSGLWR